MYLIRNTLIYVAYTHQLHPILPEDTMKQKRKTNKQTKKSTPKRLKVFEHLVRTLRLLNNFQSSNTNTFLSYVFEKHIIYIAFNTRLQTHASV